MIESFTHKSENENLYIYDDQYRLSMLVHPEFEKAYEKSDDADSYYSKKYIYLKKHGFFGNPKLAQFRVLEEIMVKQNIISTNQIVFETTESCNLSCSYCALGELYEVGDIRNGKKIDTRYAINLLQYIIDHKPKGSRLTISFYGGEALLNIKFIKHIIEVANHLSNEKKIEIQYSMTTNGTLIHKCMDFLVANNFDLLISLDGNENNHSYRIFSKSNKNSFQKVIENIDMVKKFYPEYFFYHVNFNAVLHNRNSVKEIFEFIYMRYNKIPRISPLNKRDANLKEKDTLERMFHDVRQSEYESQKGDSGLKEIMRTESTSYVELAGFLKYYSINYYISNIKTLLHSVEKYLPTGTCPPFSKKIFLTTHHKLYPCEKISYKYSMGIMNDKLEVDIKEITYQYNFHYNHLTKFCQHCYLYKFCEECIFHMNNLDNIETKEFVCVRFHNQNAFKNKLYRIFSYIEKYPTDFSQILENLTYS